MRIEEPRFRVIVRANSKKSRLTGFDMEKQAYRVEVKAPPEKGRANKEVIRLLSKALGKKVRIASGLKSREKVIALSE